MQSAKTMDILGGRRGITYPYAYMLLGQLVAMSVATSLFLVALSLHPRIHPSPRTIPLYIALPLVMAFVPIYFLPQDVGTGRFMKMLLWLHGALFLVLTSPPRAEKTSRLAKVYPPLFSIQCSLLWPASSISPLQFALSPPFPPDNHSPRTSTPPSSPTQPNHPSPSTSFGYSSSFQSGQSSPAHLFSDFSNPRFSSPASASPLSTTPVSTGALSQV